LKQRLARPSLAHHNGDGRGDHGVKVVSLHHDISTPTAEEVVLFTLAESPGFRETRKK
jgi:hypothetical protein